MVRFVVALAVLVTLLAATPARGQDDAWVASWGAAMQGPYPRSALGPGQYAFLGDQAHDQTFRMIVHLSTGGTRLRIRLSNLEGSKSVTFTGLRVAKRTRYSLVNPATDRPYTFGGQGSVTIPPGGHAVSDPVDLETAAGDDLAVTFYIPGSSGDMTFHGAAFATSYVSGALSGDISSHHDGNGFSLPVLSWFFLEGVEVSGGPATSSVVAFGDSITDGFFTNPDANTRWPDLLGKRLGEEFGIVNAGINGNSITTARNKTSDPFAGPPGVERFERDVLQRAGVRTVIVLEGLNDLSVDTGPDPIKQALTDVTEQAQAAGICVIGATMTPRSDPPLPYGWNASRNEPERQNVNDWIRSPIAPFDAVLDTDMAVRWSEHPEQLNPDYDLGDRLHINVRGRQRIADTVSLDVIRRCAAPAPPACERRDRVVVRLPKGLRGIRVRSGGTVQRARRGTRRVVLDVSDRTGASVRVRVRATRRSGERYRVTRRYALCRRGAVR